MDLSVIIVNWNTKDLLLQCLKSVYQAVCGIEKEVFVVDNGSIDGSMPVARERFPETNLIENPKNLGFAKANNQAMGLSTGEYILLLNPDTLVTNGAIEKLVSFMKAHPEAGGAGVQLLNSDGTRQNSIANFPSLATELINKSLLRWLFPKIFPGKERSYSEPIEVESVIGACMILRREAMEQVGGLDEDYFLFLEETDWCYRIRKAGWKIYHIPQAEIYHFQGKSAEIEEKNAKVEYYRSRYLFFKKNKGRVQWLILLIGLMIRLWTELTFMATVCFFSCCTVKKWRRKLLIYAYLVGWHLRGCPEEMGMKPIFREDYFSVR
jgi:GT2 family glycosyltransferase